MRSTAIIFMALFISLKSYSLPIFSEAGKRSKRFRSSIPSTSEFKDVRDIDIAIGSAPQITILIGTALV